MADTTTLTPQDQLNDYIAQVAALTQANASLDHLIQQETASYNDWVAHGDYVEAKRHSDVVYASSATKAGNQTKIDSLNLAIKTLQAQIQAAVDAQTAANALTNAQANLSPDQLLQLQINAQNTAAAAAKAKADADAAAAAATAKADADKANIAAGNTKYYLIAAAVILIVVVAIWGFVSIKKSKGAA